MQIKALNHRACFCSGLLSHFIVFISGFNKSFPQTEGNFIIPPPPAALLPGTAAASVTILRLCSYSGSLTWAVPSTGATTAETWDPMALSSSGWVHFDNLSVMT